MSVKIDYYKEFIDEIVSEVEELEFDSDEDLYIELDLSKYNSTENLEGIEWYDCLDLNIRDSFTIDLSEKNPSNISLKTVKYISENIDQIIENACKYICKNEKLIKIYEAFDAEKQYGIPIYEDYKLATRHFYIDKIYIHKEEKDGYKYFGLKGKCNWDSGHGIGILFYKDEVKILGDWDDAACCRIN
ncbi:DUF6985 domain-containing protein [Aureivirga sp. CE67]|uniref:DUF6985 domain-containing protein n=1 Tax=Aureivirga sp. CE67 TaxID=1788983 RepID=UPI0018CBC275|nr:hypothetical protein [Aureivirga sp. CE67]